MGANMWREAQGGYFAFCLNINNCHRENRSIRTAEMCGEQFVSLPLRCSLGVFRYGDFNDAISAR